MTLFTEQIIAGAMPAQFDAHGLEKRCLCRNPLEVADKNKRRPSEGQS